LLWVSLERRSRTNSQTNCSTHRCVTKSSDISAWPCISCVLTCESLLFTCIHRTQWG
jgi:hypothetical protein